MPAEHPGAPSGEGGTLSALSRALHSRTTRSEAVTDACLARITERDSSINAFITVLADEARAQARAADQEIAAGRYRGPLHGVPISLKDLIDLRGTPTTAASRVRRGHVAARDSVVSARLRAAGAVFVGKTNLHEFALGTTNEDSAYGPVHHPLDHSRSPGGSSGGSAASILAGMCYASIGSDTGGSVRIPSAVVRAGRPEAGRGRDSNRWRGPPEQHARSHRAAVPIGRGRRRPASDPRRRVESRTDQGARASWPAPRHPARRTSSRCSTLTSRLDSTNRASA